MTVETVEQILLDRINYWKRKYENMRADFEKSDDAADYWQEAYAHLFNAIHRAITDTKLNETQNVLAVIAILEKHAGQSDQEVQL